MSSLSIRSPISTNEIPRSRCTNRCIRQCARIYLRSDIISKFATKSHSDILTYEGVEYMCTTSNVRPSLRRTIYTSIQLQNLRLYKNYLKHFISIFYLYKSLYRISFDIFMFVIDIDFGLQ